LKPTFLVIDDNPDSRFLLVKTLLRKFPHAALEECQQADAAVARSATCRYAAIVVHRTPEVDGVTLIGMLRHRAPSVPIVMVSGIDRTQQALAAGATCFLHYDEWLRIGTVVAQLLDRGGPEPPESTKVGGAVPREQAP
jgi:CheY-like chemotaxis protein